MRSFGNGYRRVTGERPSEHPSKHASTKFGKLETECTHICSTRISELIARAKDQIAVNQMAGRSKAAEIEIIQLTDQDKSWTRPAGVVALAVMGGLIAGVPSILIAQIIMLKLGLIH